MDLGNVPQEGNKNLAGHKKAVYAKDADGHIVVVASNGWEVEEIVTSQAVAEMQSLADTARQNVLNGLSAPLEYWMYARRMDLLLLAQTTGIWRWRIRRHFRPVIFAQLSDRMLTRYAEALGMTIQELKHLP
ncbi:MAG: hypothetical protein ABI536_04890 [Gallionella sp.]